MQTPQQVFFNALFVLLLILFVLDSRTSVFEQSNPSVMDQSMIAPRGDTDQLTPITADGADWSSESAGSRSPACDRLCETSPRVILTGEDYLRFYREYQAFSLMSEELYGPCRGYMVPKSVPLC